MTKVFIVPPNSLILYDLVERFGHEPLSIMGEMRERVTKPEMDSPPLNVTQEEIKKGLKYAGIEVPSGVRGRLALWGPLIDQASAAIIMHDMPYTFGCVGCHRTNLMLIYMVRKKKIPVLEVHYPKDEEEAKVMVTRVKTFLEGLK
ncbi:methanogenesis marker 5 protein [Methanomassiliicoccus luminyensis]|uniref:methanogenesis marker 5 protein n=1 Tax=Methanomassiliicoccus luminyensis TaxID=1080712 RepID=UPI0003683E43|nr:methanogenesis marker 5 protein [Methanomassiliicoccus luminyensis]